MCFIGICKIKSKKIKKKTKFYFCLIENLFHNFGLKTCLIVPVCIEYNSNTNTCGKPPSYPG